MAGHSKWAQIKRQKGSEDAKRSKIFSKLSRLITSESKRVGGKIDSPTLRTIIETAKKENMPKDTIERAVKKGIESGAGDSYEVRYEAYGPSGTAIIIEGFTDNKNRTVQEIKHILTSSGGVLAGTGSALWAFEKKEDNWIPTSTVELKEEEKEILAEIIEKLESHSDVESVYTNAI